MGSPVDWLEENRAGVRPRRQLLEQGKWSLQTKGGSIPTVHCCCPWPIPGPRVLYKGQLPVLSVRVGLSLDLEPDLYVGNPCSYGMFIGGEVVPRHQNREVPVVFPEDWFFLFQFGVTW